MTRLPPFPVDDLTLDLLQAAIDPWGHGHPDAERSSLWDLLTLMARLGGSDTDAVAAVEPDGGRTMRDPSYSDHDVVLALIGEVRRLRSSVHEYDQDSVLNATTGKPYGPDPLWAGTEPMDYPDPRCTCGALWGENGSCTAEVERMRPVVEAAAAYAKAQSDLLGYRPDTDPELDRLGTLADAQRTSREALLAAVDAYQQGATDA